MCGGGEVEQKQSERGQEEKRREESGEEKRQSQVLLLEGKSSPYLRDGSHHEVVTWGSLRTYGGKLVQVHRVVCEIHAEGEVPKLLQTLPK